MSQNNLFPSQSEHSASLALSLSPYNNGSDPPSQIIVGDLFQSPTLLPFPTATYSPSPYPMFYPLPPPSADPVPPKKRRARCVPGLTKEQRKTLYAERNRQFARESRERKQQYVEGLEKELAVLRAELARYRSLFARYELIDRKRNLGGEEWSAAIMSALGEVQRTRGDTGQFQTVLLRKLDEQFEEQRRALEQLFRIMLEISVPLLVRFKLWKAESGLDMFNVVEMCKFMGYDPDSDFAKRVAEHIRTAHAGEDTRAAQREQNAKLERISARIRDNVRKMLDCHKDIQRDSYRAVHSMKLLVHNARYTAEQAAEDLKFMPRINWRPELSDESILKISNQDFWLDPGSLATEPEDDSGASAAGSGPVSTPSGGVRRIVT